MREPWGWGEVEPDLVGGIVKNRGGRTGRLETSFDPYGNERLVRLRKRKRMTLTEDRGAFVPEPLSVEIRLPGFAPGEEAGWIPIGQPSVFEFDAQNRPRRVLAYLEHARAKPSDPRQPAGTMETVEWIEDEAGASQGEAA